MARTIEEQRERARRYATNIVGFAIMAVGVAFLIAAGVLVSLGARQAVLAAFLVIVGLLALVGGFFFHLVPSRIDRLEDRKRAYDAGHREVGENGHAPRK